MLSRLETIDSVTLMAKVQFITDLSNIGHLSKQDLRSSSCFLVQGQKVVLSQEAIRACPNDTCRGSRKRNLTQVYLYVNQPFGSPRYKDR